MTKTPEKTAKSAREARLAGALRANLVRRKASSRPADSKTAAAKPAATKENNG